MKYLLPLAFIVACSGPTPQSENKSTLENTIVEGYDHAKCSGGRLSERLTLGQIPEEIREREQTGRPRYNSKSDAIKITSCDNVCVAARMNDAINSGGKVTGKPSKYLRELKHTLSTAAGARLRNQLIPRYHQLEFPTELAEIELERVWNAPASTRYSSIDPRYLCVTLSLSPQEDASGDYLRRAFQF